MSQNDAEHIEITRPKKIRNEISIDRDHDPSSRIDASMRTTYGNRDVAQMIAVGLTAYIASFILMWQFHWQLGLAYRRTQSIHERYTSVLRLQIYTVTPLLAALSHVMFIRFTHQSARNPLSGNEHLTDIANRILRNTVEHYLFFLINVFILATVITDRWQYLLPFHCFCWTVGRTGFHIGYCIHPKYRAYGFIYQFVSTLSMFVHNLLAIIGLIEAAF